MKILNWLLPPLLLLQCIQGTNTTSLGKYINTPCRSVSDCGLDNYLQCINGNCQCDNFDQIYDENTQKCLLLVGQKCEWFSPNGIKCVPNANCNNSTCRCKPGYRSSTDLLCKPDYGTPCHVKDDCDETQGLICSQGICQCFNSTWTYQGHFGCVDPNSSQFSEMMTLLNQTQRLLKENNLEIKDMFNDLGLQNDPNSEFIFGNMLAEARQFQDTYNTNDLQFAAQNQDSQQSGGRFNFAQLFSLFQNFQGLFGNRNGGGFLRNLFGGGGNKDQGGYPESKPAPASGYGAPGQPEGMQSQRFKLINNFLNLFNQMIPIVRQLKMRFSPVRFLQNFLNRFSTTTAAPAPAPAAEIHNAPPTVIQSSGNFQPNPIFNNNQQTSEQSSNNQGEGTFRFIMKTRERFRNLLRGNQQSGGSGGGGYDYTPANPPSQYGSPPAEAAAPASEAPQEAGAAQQNYYTSHNQAPQRNSFNTQPQQHAATNTYNTLPSSPVQGQTVPAQRQQTFGSQGFNSGQHNPQSFFNQAQHDQQQQNFNQNHQQQHVQQPHHQQQVQQHNHQQVQHNHQQQVQQTHHQQVQQPHHQQQHTQHHQPQQQLNNNNHFNNNFNAQATSHQQTTFVPHPQPQNSYLNSHHQPAQSQNTFAFSNSRTPISGPGQTTASSIPTLPPPPIPQFKLQLQSQKPAQLPHELLAQNFILSEADDPHPGFTPHSTSPPTTTPQGSFRTAARFERIDDPNSHNTDTTVANTAQQNWRDSF